MTRSRWLNQIGKALDYWAIDLLRERATGATVKDSFTVRGGTT